MRIPRCAPLLLCLCAWADENTDRAAIEKALIVFNRPSERHSVLARDADLRALRRVEDDQAWSEVSPLYFSGRSAS